MGRLLILCTVLAAGCGQPLEGEADFATGAVDSGAPVPDLTMSTGCNPKCANITPFCNPSNKCVGCLSDADCAKGSYCKIVSDALATCTPGCMSDDRCANGQKCCGNQCADPATDVRNCGGCGMPCMAVHAAATCVAGMCQSGKCDSGWGDCNLNGGDGCETNLHSDVDNCTGCGMKCSIPNAFVGCADGCYATACKLGFDDCNLNGNDGCETSVLSDKNNCGGCGKPCVNLPNASSTCVNAMCLLSTCNMGYADCDKNPMNGCEVNLAYDKNNCNGCGIKCPVNEFCGKGVCGVNVQVPFANWMGVDWFKIMVNGAMTDNNIIAACQAVGLTVPCQMMGQCMYNDQKCKMMTPEKSCGNPMQGLAQGICNGQGPSNCPALFGAFQYMGNAWQGGCGALQGQWCVTGNNAMNQFALCVQ